MDAVHVVFLGNLLADVCYIAGCGGRFGIHITLVANLPYQGTIAPTQLLTSVGVPFSHRDGHHPRMQFHTSAMTLVNGKLQGVVARTLARLS